MSQAADAYAQRRPGSVAVLRAGHGRQPAFRQYEIRTRVHYAAPDRYRLLQEANDYVHRPHDVLVVSDGEREWTYDAAERDAYVQTPNHHDIDTLLDPSWIVAACVVTVSGRSSYEGRSVIEFQARPRAEWVRSRWHDFALGGFADELHGVIDAEYGLLLSLAGHFGGAPYEVKRLTDLQIDATVDDDLFAFSAPPGVHVEDVDAHPERRAPLRLRLLARYHIYRMRRRLRRNG